MTLGEKIMWFAKYGYSVEIRKSWNDAYIVKMSTGSPGITRSNTIVTFYEHDITACVSIDEFLMRVIDEIIYRQEATV